MLYIDKIRLDKKISKNSYLNDIPLIKELINGREVEFNKNVTFFIGENGSGKSTLLEAIALAMGFNPEGGSINFNFSSHDDEYELADLITISRNSYPKDGFFLRAESYFNLASEIEKLGVAGYGDKSLHEQSHGEGFMALFQNRFWGKGLYILDEPESALSPIRQLAFLSCIDQLVKKESQFIISTHSPILLAYPNADIYNISQDGIEKIKYKESEIYNVYRDFLNEPERWIKNLL